MLDEKSLKQLFAIALVAVLIILSILVLKPIAMSIILGLILAYIFYPFYKILIKVTKNKTITALITCVLVFGIFFVIFWFLLPLLANQVFDMFRIIQSWDASKTFETFFPFLFNNPQLAANFMATYSNFVTTTTSSILKSLTNILLDLPTILLQLTVVILVFFYSLRDGDKTLEIIRDSLPFSKSITNKFIRKSSDVTFSVVFGRILVGIIVGIFTGLGFFLAGIPNSFLLTFIAIIVSIIPIIGPWLVWIPVVISLFVTGKTFAAIILLIYYGLFISFLDNILHALIVAKKAKVSTSLQLIGLIGGIFVFGIFGIILGPLIVAYLEALFELYRDYNIKTRE
jgi:predicted PurR-regulated permease PerM